MLQTLVFDIPNTLLPQRHIACFMNVSGKCLGKTIDDRVVYVRSFILTDEELLTKHRKHYMIFLKGLIILRFNFKFSFFHFFDGSIDVDMFAD